MRVLPRTLPALLTESIAILRRNWVQLVVPAMMTFIPAGVLTLLIFIWTGAIDFLTLVFERPAFLQSLAPEVLMVLARPFIQASVAAVAIQGVAALFVLLVCHRVVAHDIAETRVRSGQATGFAVRRLAPALVAAILVVVPVAAALFAGLTIWLVPALSAGASNPVVSLVGVVLLAALLAPGLWLLVSFSMTTPALAVEGAGIAASLARSLRLVKGRRMATLGFLLLVGLASLIAVELIQLVAIPVALVAGENSALLIGSVLGIAMQGLIVSAVGVPLTLWYVDLRARAEVLVSEDLL